MGGVLLWSSVPPATLHQSPETLLYEIVVHYLAFMNVVLNVK